MSENRTAVTKGLKCTGTCLQNSKDLNFPRSRSLFLHVSVFGQSPGAEDLTIPFPSLEDIALGLVTALDLMKISKVICLGDGAGANICLR